MASGDQINLRPHFQQRTLPCEAEAGDLLTSSATVCQNWCDYVRGVKAQAYWSQLEGNGALPTMYSLRRTLIGKSIGGKIPRPNSSVNAWIANQF